MLPFPISLDFPLAVILYRAEENLFLVNLLAALLWLYLIGLSGEKKSEDRDRDTMWMFIPLRFRATRPGQMGGYH